MLDELVDVSRAVRLTDDRHMTNMLADLERIHAAIEREHPRRAANAMEHHIVVVRDAYLNTLTRQGSGIGRISVNG
jgi:DNA-binding FadR family transcriptional regulator